MSFLKVSEILKSSILRTGDPYSLVALLVFKAFEDVIFELYGKKYPKKEIAKIRPKKFASGTLTVCTPSSTWNQELQLKKEEILDRLNKNLGGRIVKNVKSRVQPIHPSG